MYNLMYLNPKMYGGGALYAPPLVIFCPFLEISWNLKFLDLSKLFVADDHMKKLKNLVLFPLRAHLIMGLEIARAWEG